jgi:hypothetical protein
MNVTASKRAPDRKSERAPTERGPDPNVDLSNRIQHRLPDVHHTHLGCSLFFLIETARPLSLQV